jgi:hypothetical protein
MRTSAAEFAEYVGPLIQRYFAQNDAVPPSGAEVEAFAARLWSIVAERGLPPALAQGERGEPREMTEAECAPLVARVIEGSTDPLWADVARQLLKACLYPEFKTCRESYHAVSADGVCRRQELTRTRKRASGAHCVDCPYWQLLGREEHAKLLRARWCGDAAQFDAHRDVYLPEDFRALRRWIRALAPRV